MKIVQPTNTFRRTNFNQAYSGFFSEKNLDKFHSKFISSVPSSTSKPNIDETGPNVSLKIIGDKLQPYLTIVAVLGATFGLYNALKGNIDDLGKRLDDQNSTLNKRLDDQNTFIYKRLDDQIVSLNKRLEDKYLVIGEKINDLRRDFKEVNNRRWW